LVQGHNNKQKNPTKHNLKIIPGSLTHVSLYTTHMHVRICMTIHIFKR